MTIAYIRDIPALLSLWRAICEKDISLGLEAEGDMLKHIFIFDHLNDWQWLFYQHASVNFYRST